MEPDSILRAETNSCHPVVMIHDCAALLKYKLLKRAVTNKRAWLSYCRLSCSQRTTRKVVLTSFIFYDEATQIRPNISLSSSTKHLWLEVWPFQSYCIVYDHSDRHIRIQTPCRFVSVHRRVRKSSHTVCGTDIKHDNSKYRDGKLLQNVGDHPEDIVMSQP